MTPPNFCLLDADDNTNIDSIFNDAPRMMNTIDIFCDTLRYYVISLHEATERVNERPSVFLSKIAFPPNVNAKYCCSKLLEVMESAMGTNPQSYGGVCFSIEDKLVCAELIICTTKSLEESKAMLIKILKKATGADKCEEVPYDNCGDPIDMD